ASCRVLFRSAAAVLANSGREPFGLVGLETMAAGGGACTGGTGEDYVGPGKNGLGLETTNPWEVVSLFREVRANPARERALRRGRRATARHYTWPTLSSGSSCHGCTRWQKPRVRTVAIGQTTVSGQVAGLSPQHSRPWRNTDAHRHCHRSRWIWFEGRAAHPSPRRRV